MGRPEAEHRPLFAGGGQRLTDKALLLAGSTEGGQDGPATFWSFSGEQKAVSPPVQPVRSLTLVCQLEGVLA